MNRGGTSSAALSLVYGFCAAVNEIYRDYERSDEIQPIGNGRAGRDEH